MDSCVCVLFNSCFIWTFFIFLTDTAGEKKKQQNDAKIKALRKKLLKTQSNMDIVESGKFSTKEWSKFALTSDNDENVYQRYVKIQTNKETGYEEFLIKKISEN